MNLNELLKLAHSNNHITNLSKYVVGAISSARIHLLRVREKDERAADPPGSFPKNSNYRHYVFGWPPRLTYRLSTGGVPSRSSASKVVTVAQSVRNYTVVLYLFSRSRVQVTEHNLRTQYTVPASHQTTNLLLTTRSAYISGLGPSTVFWPRPVLYENVHTLPLPFISPTLNLEGCLINIVILWHSLSRYR